MEMMTQELTIEEYGRIVLTEINDLMKQGIIREVYNKRHSCQADDDYLSELAHIKRFLELWSADSELRELMRNGDPLPAKYDFDLDLEELRTLWDVDSDYVMPPMSSLRYKAFNLEKLTHRNRMRENCSSSLAEYNAWRSREMERCNMELAPLTAYSIVHAPFCIELCSGCSVGCWFCGISAPKLDDIFFYNEENKNLFNAVLVSLKGVFGEAAEKGFCYWATDPMDNPDYEKFMVDFHKVLGFFPQTTTALPLKDVERTKKLLKLSAKLNGKLDRFSVLSLRQLLKVFDAFTPEELLYVELVTQNKESYGAKSKAGRAIKGGEKRISEENNQTGNQVTDGTIACVSGFIISMVHKTVKLISPCMANERWPLGYIVFMEGTFKDGQEFHALINDMVKQQMLLNLPLDKEMKFLKNLTYTEYEDGFSVNSKHLKKSFRENPYFKQIGQLIVDGNVNAQDIISLLEAEYGYMPAQVLFALNQIYNEGVISI